MQAQSVSNNQNKYPVSLETDYIFRYTLIQDKTLFKFILTAKQALTYEEFP